MSPFISVLILAVLVLVLLSSAILYLYREDRRDYLLYGGAAQILGALWMVANVFLQAADVPRLDYLPTAIIVVPALLLWAAAGHAMAGRRLSRRWVIGGGLVGVVIVSAGALRLPDLAIHLPCAVFTSACLLAASVRVLRSGLRPAASRLVFGVSLLIYSAHQLDYPWVRTVPALLPWAYIAAIGLIMVGGLSLLAFHVERTQVERDALSDQLGRAEKMEAIGRLAGGVAHDFNNLLTVIISSLGLVQRQSLPPAQQTQLLDSAAAAAERAARLTQQLLAFSRRQTLDIRVVDIRGMVQEIQGMLRSLLAESIALELFDDGRPTYVMADRQQLERVLLNLVMNAGDSLEGAGRVTVRTLSRGQGPTARAVLEVSDTGRGIDLETRKHLFEPFFTTKAMGAGTGLGLSTAHGIIKQCGGDIDVETAVGRGSTFRVLLPLSDAPSTIPETVPTSPPATARGTILLVEDEALIRDVAKLTLERAGYTTCRRTMPI